MINKDRIIPIQKCDFLTMIAIVMRFAEIDLTIASASNAEGDFTITGGGDIGSVLCNEPVKTLDFADGVSDGIVYFVPANSFAGVKIAGVAVETDPVKADGITLYTADYANGAVTVAPFSPIAE